MKKKDNQEQQIDYSTLSKHQLEELIKETKDKIANDDNLLKARGSYHVYKHDEIEKNWLSIFSYGLAGYITTHVGAGFFVTAAEKAAENGELTPYLIGLGGVAVTAGVLAIYQMGRKLHKINSEATSRVEGRWNVKMHAVESRVSDTTLVQRAEKNRELLKVLKKELDKREDEEKKETMNWRY